MLVYPVLMESLWEGRTAGQSGAGAARGQDGRRPDRLSPRRHTGRFGLIEVWGTFGSLGFLVMLFSGRDQRLGDMAAGALVLRERPGRALRPVQLLVPPGCEQLVMTMDVGAMSADDYELVRSFLRPLARFRRPAARDGGGHGWRARCGSGSGTPSRRGSAPTTTWPAWVPPTSTVTSPGQAAPAQATVGQPVRCPAPRTTATGRQAGPAPR